jgi:geranylgeranyl reductase family protein
MKKLWDIIIIGAGPSGCTLASVLAKKNISVLVIERQKLPRYKTCGGGINVRAANLTDCNFQDVVENVAFGLRLSYKHSDNFTRMNGQPLTYTVMRDRFDYLLAAEAKRAGAQILEGERVTQVTIGGDKFTVSTGGSHFVAKIVVGADGANSIVAHSLGLMSNYTLDLGMQAEVYVKPTKLSSWFGLLGVNYGNIPEGYGWIFPKRDHLSIGVGGPIRLAKELTGHLTELIERQDLGNFKILTLKSALIPLRDKGSAIARSNALLVGDAAGLIDAFTGDGIYYGLRSARLAASAIDDYLSGKASNLLNYEQAVDTKLMPELRLARTLVRRSTWIPKAHYNLLKRSDRAWQAFCDILRGEKSYLDFKEEVVPLRVLMSLLRR